MNSSVTETTESSNGNASELAAAAAPAAQTGDGSQSAQSAEPAANGNAESGQHRRNRRGGRGGNNKGRGDATPSGRRAPGDSTNAARTGGQQDGAPRAPRRQHPVLLKLQEVYPQLFGEQPKPLKRGIFQDLEAALAGESLDIAELKIALGIHTRSMRYLQAVSQGQPRHDLAGNVVEQMAPEHVFHALVEVFRRRKPRDGEDLTQKLRRRMVMAFEASGLTREAYLDLVRGRDDATNALLDEALADVAARNAKDEAILRAFEASGAANVEAFADMYGMQARTVAQQLERAKRLRN